MKQRKPEWVKIVTPLTCSIKLERGKNNTNVVKGGIKHGIIAVVHVLGKAH